MAKEHPNNYCPELKENLVDSTVFLVRHGETMANVFGCLLSDPPLTKRGREQAAQAGKQLRHLMRATVVHTGLVRTTETALLIKEYGCLEGELVSMPGLQERIIGGLEGLSFSDFLSRYPDLKPVAEQYGGSCIWFLEDEPVGLEPIVLMYDRIVRELEQLEDILGTKIVVCHSGTIKMLRAHQAGVPRNREILSQSLVGIGVPFPGSIEEFKLRNV